MQVKARGLTVRARPTFVLREAEAATATAIAAMTPMEQLTEVLRQPLPNRGRAGSVHHAINARLSRAGGGLNVSDLMLVPQAPNGGELPRPRPSGIIDTETLTAMIEMSGNDAVLLTRSRATIEIADAENGSALVTVEARQAMRSNNLRAFAATLRLGVLPPGEYVARATVKVPGQPDLRLVRPFLMAPVAADTPEVSVDPRVPLDPDAPPAPLAEVKIFAPVPRFVRDSVLMPAVVAPFLDGLAALHPPSPAVEELIEKARAGQFTPPAESGSTPDDEVNLAFPRGLEALNKGQVPQAAAWFQQTLKGASDFLGAAFYLGATHAALGRDKEAVGAW